MGNLHIITMAKGGTSFFQWAKGGGRIFSGSERGDQNCFSKGSKMVKNDSFLTPKQDYVRNAKINALRVCMVIH